MMKIITVLFVCVLVFGAGCNTGINQQTGAAQQTKTIKEKPIDETANGALILYWAEGCSHCERVKFEIQQTGLDKKLNIIAKESYGNDEKYREFFERVQYCQVPEYQMGVPMLWDGERCYLGVTDIMEELDNRMRDER
jgi:thioredoxin-related protein